MKKLHTKSPCCGAATQRFGYRRRRCTQCYKTWRTHKKKRGRKQKRVNAQLVYQYLAKEISSLRVLAQNKKFGKDSLQIQLRRSLEKYVVANQNNWRTLLPPNEYLIAVADAIWYRIHGKKYAIYIILLRPINSNRAVICPPMVIAGPEGMAGWKEALSQLPDPIRNRILALVCDGVGSLIILGRSHQWVVQRCHFHLIASVQNYLSSNPQRTKQHLFAIKVLTLVQKLLHTNDFQKIRIVSAELRAIQTATTSRGLRRVLGGFLTNLNDYHVYLNKPELNLPTTSNAAESFIQSIRDLMYRCRGFRTEESLALWIIALSIFKKTIGCNGKNRSKNQPN